MMDENRILSLLENVRPSGVIEGAFAGNDDEQLYINAATDFDTEKEIVLALYNGCDKWICGTVCEQNQEKEYAFPLSKLCHVKPDDTVLRICIGVLAGKNVQMYYLRNRHMRVSKACKEEMYDRRTLFGSPILLEEKMQYVLPHYRSNTVLAIVITTAEDIYVNQIQNEILSKEYENGQNEIWYTRCKKVEGNYIGICPENRKGTEEILRESIAYSTYEEDNEFVYMKFCISKNAGLNYYITWKCHGEVYRAPLEERMTMPLAELLGIEVLEDKKIYLKVCADETKYGKVERAMLVSCGEEWEEKFLYPQEINVLQQDNGMLYFSVLADLECITNIGKWEILIYTKDEPEEKILATARQENRDEEIKETLCDYTFPDGENTKTRLKIKYESDRLIFEREYGHNALTTKNIQDCSAFLQGRPYITLKEFLAEDVGPRGNIYAEYEQDSDGNVQIQISQKMPEVIEAELVMFHTQGLGIVSAQTLEVKDGKIQGIRVEIPDVEASGKILKPLNSIWFRVALAIRTEKGIYFPRLKNFDIDANAGDDKLYDIRRLYSNSIGTSEICGIKMRALVYYGGNQQISLKYVRPDQEFRSQFTNELLDVVIRNDIMSVKMRCRDCQGIYKGVLLEYRKEKEDDAETYLIPYKKLEEVEGGWIMETDIDLKKYYLRMLYWDIRCAFEKDGEIYNVSCHSNDEKFLKKYKGVFVGRSYPSENSILFPYATANNSVALMHRETCPQDHWQFRLKERIAVVIYKMLSGYWDKKNIYLIFEKYCVMAQDNGYYFFKYCMDENVEKTFDGKLFYVLDSKAPDWEKIAPYKSHVVKYLSIRHMIYLLACRLMISTDTKAHAYVWRSMGSEIKAASYQKKLVFLQHGVTAFKRGHFERGTNVGCEYFITTSQFEHDIIHKYLGYPEEEIPITGFARWDVLHDKSEGHREILMMPTWRTWLDDAENEIFAESDYCKNYMALLNNPELDKLLREYDITLNFYLHPKFRKFITEFSVVSDHIRLIPFGEEPLNELMMQCNLLITDFSSVAWDVYYMKKPVLFYHFDMEDANKTLGFYMDMENDLFGERAEKPEELMGLIEQYIRNGFQMKQEYKDMHSQYFAYVDDHNSERIWRAIQEREW